jgi:hypothetical protein
MASSRLRTSGLPYIVHPATYPAIQTLNVNDAYFRTPSSIVDTVYTPQQFTAATAASSVFQGTQGGVAANAVSGALGAAAGAVKGAGASAPAPGSVEAIRAAQTVINAGLPASIGPMLMEAALAAGEPMVPVPAAYGGAPFASQRKSASSVMNYLFPPTMVSRVPPISAAAFTAAVAAAAATNATRVQ